MSRIIYMLDTNILCDWLVGANPGLLAAHSSHSERVTRARQFCENNAHRICIPDLVWVEFLSVVLHKNIDVSGDFKRTRQWVRNQEIMVQQMELFVENAPHMSWLHWEADISPYPDAQDLLRDTGLINQKVFHGMKRSAKGQFTEKLLDGMDSVILIYLNELAHERKKNLVVLYTADYRLWQIFPRIRSYQREWFAQNTASVCAVFRDVECKWCRHRNPGDILRQEQIRCQKCGGFALMRNP